MDGVQKFISRMVLTGIVGIIVIVTVAQARFSYYNYLIASAEDPMATACALDSPGAFVNPTCVIYWKEANHAPHP